MLVTLHHFSKFRGRNKISLKPPPRGLESGICVDFSLKKPYFLGICLFQCLQSGVIILPLQTMHLEILEMYYTFASFDCPQNGSHFMIPFSWLETQKLPFHWGPMSPWPERRWDTRLMGCVGFLSHSWDGFFWISSVGYKLRLGHIFAGISIPRSCGISEGLIRRMSWK